MSPLNPFTARIPTTTSTHAAGSERKIRQFIGNVVCSFHDSVTVTGKEVLRRIEFRVGKRLPIQFPKKKEEMCSK
ncbi:hypothetical protein CEXT_763471 [Caerostris extrusa]|uniref:Uncharacterized protein n=1 Tax=Caerostris extrusa TaxID=172846 RepID=A0AAV4WR53_CAEEX|nr:hypothetical protein CEXT_763471 [Caerostris extrusa]